MRQLLILLFLAFGLTQAYGQKKIEPSPPGQQPKDIELTTATGKLYGSLELPASRRKMPVVLIIPGSGPTDRDGNNMFQVNNSLKGLADSLRHHGLATLRFDKRGIGASKAAVPGEEDLRFEIYVEDVTDWMRLLRKDRRFNKIIVLGHSEGSLIGMLAVTREKADGYISLAGPALPADEIVMQQLKDNRQLPSTLIDSCRMMFDLLKEGKRIDSVPKYLMSIFRPSVQAYIASWIRYDPRQELLKLQMPTLILQGTHDIQVPEEQADILARIKPDARLVKVEGMNHIFRIAPQDREANIATYDKADLPIAQKLVSAISSFVKSIH